MKLNIDDKGLIISEIDNISGFDLLEEDILRLNLRAKYFDKDTISSFNYIRLKPTKTDLTRERIESLTYLDVEGGQVRSTIKFNKELWDDEMLRINNTSQGEMYKILRIDSTFFLARYIRGIRKSLLPIQEVTLDYIQLYGVPEGIRDFIGRK